MIALEAHDTLAHAGCCCTTWQVLATRMLTKTARSVAETPGKLDKSWLKQGSDAPYAPIQTA